MSSANRIVSSESEELILVDAEDREHGFLSKAACHDGDGRLHRAFSLFLFDSDGRLLLQQRSGEKRLWPGYWSNSICSHPRRGETLDVATRRRLDDELNVGAELEYVYKFQYQAGFGQLGAEHELCHVFLGRLTGEPVPNDSEIAAVRFVTAPELDQEIAMDRSGFTPWFMMEWQNLRDEHASTLEPYLAGPA